MAKIRVVIRNMDDVINFQILRWQHKYPGAAEPEEWSENEIRPDEHYEAHEDLSEADEISILRADRHWVGSQAGSGMVRRGTYERGYGQHRGSEFQALAANSHQEHYDTELKKVLEELEKEYGDEYEIVYEGEYAKKFLDDGQEIKKTNRNKKGI